ncbi:MAG TPA: GMC oxidoreductase [Vicinamibacterales bacterium]|nr:GMC oxidoreductase [Vicinamibacterales bacterium]
MATTDCDYVVVGSGAGGGPLAANLARAGFSVVLLEAGGDPCSQDETGRLLYEVPIFHTLATEYPECQWDYFVRHYTDSAKQRLDSKYVAAEDGVWYPRAGALGGCTTHNAMITVLPNDDDWDNIAALTGDSSWAAEKMHDYFRRLETCHYVPRPNSLLSIAERVLASAAPAIGVDPSRLAPGHGHGFDGWLGTCEANPTLALRDPDIIAIVLNAVFRALHDHVGDPLRRLETLCDPNDSRNLSTGFEGVTATPLAVLNGRRNGPREFIMETQREYPGKLTVQQHALASRVLFDGRRAIGVEYLDGPHVYKADPAARTKGSARAAGVPVRQVRAKKEVILAAGAFNSPQLLKLSGVGPRNELSRLGINVIADLPGVGENLQDRYEVGIVSSFRRDFRLLDDATFALPVPNVPDPAFDEWKTGRGLYTSNGSIIGIVKRSKPTLKTPDLYIFGLPGFFRGYVPGYSKQTERYRNAFTWAVLKAYTKNTAGRVSLRSADPTDWPSVEFKYFGEGNDNAAEDLDAIVSGVEFVRTMNANMDAVIDSETIPGPEVTGDRLRQFIQNEAWGHHASCTNKIGADADPTAVLDSRFRVRTVEGLRVVDASVFPRIPGYFIVTPIYMISEKASDVIREDA